jgi:hypothetical protein
VNGYTELVVDVSGLYDGYTAPEVICQRARDHWLNEFAAAELKLPFGEGKQQRLDDGMYLIYWFVGTDEYWYYVTLNMNQYKVTTERKGKAQKRA